eukprot:3430633-Heterocapsa_arctica.AAC.1
MLQALAGRSGPQLLGSRYRKRALQIPPAMAEGEEDPPVDPAVYYHCISLMLRQLAESEKANKAKAKAESQG